MGAGEGESHRVSFGDLWMNTIVGAALGGIACVCYVALWPLWPPVMVPDGVLPHLWQYVPFVANPMSGAALGLIFGFVQQARRWFR